MRLPDLIEGNKQVDIHALQTLYRAGKTTPSEHIADVYARIAANGLRPVWISLAPETEAIRHANELAFDSAARELPLFGVPFAVKDNIDVARMATTAGCPAYAFTPDVSATVVRRLQDAGAILIGKTNMDQFATGLVGTRSPYGICSSVFDEFSISGGSSSGSAVAVAKGLVSFALGTDTAGSGRVPAAFNQLVGMKPTRGFISTAGVVPACRTLDCISIFAETCTDAALVLKCAAGKDAGDPYSRTSRPGNGATPWLSSRFEDSSADIRKLNPFRVGVPHPSRLEFFGDEGSAAAYQDALHAIEQLGGELVEFDYAPFQAAAELLYSGPWVAERLAAISTFHAEHAAEMDPTVERILSGAKRFSAVDTFNAAYRLEALRQETAKAWTAIDVMMLPTAPRSFTIAAVQADPTALNTKLGYYTNFVNLLDLAAVSVPAGFASEKQPFGVSLIGPPFSDGSLLVVGDCLHRSLASTLGGSTRKLCDTPSIPVPSAPPGCLLMAVVGAHLTGQPLNWQLTQREGRIVHTARTSPEYRLYALANTTPAKPGLVYERGFQGPGIEIEVWALPADRAGSFVDGVPPPLAIGTLRLEGGQQVKGFLVEPAGLEGAIEITRFGGWRKYLAGL